MKYLLMYKEFADMLCERKTGIKEGYRYGGLSKGRMIVSHTKLGTPEGRTSCN